jgi:hypothetical protein
LKFVKTLRCCCEHQDPNGWSVVTPRIMTQDVHGLVNFVKQVFDTQGEIQTQRPCELMIGDSIIMISRTEQCDVFPACLYIYVNSVEATSS